MQSFLDIENGKGLTGVHVNETKFQGATTLNQLEDYGLARPSRLEAAKAKDLKGDKKLSDSWALREAVQRRFDRKRVARAEVYARYIEAIEYGGQLGGTPAITLYLKHAKERLRDRLVVPYGATLVAIDGETQAEARFALRDDPGFNRPESGDLPIAVTIYHDCPEDLARQVLHDYNRYANPVRERELVALNPEGPLTQMTREVIRLADIDPEKVNRFSRRPLKKQSIAWSQVMHAIVGFTFKDVALQKKGDCWFDSLNNPSMDQTLRDNGICAPAVSLLSKAANTSQDARAADPLVWQVAGAMVAKGKAPETINWGAAVAAYRSCRSVRGKLDRIAAAV